MGLCIWRPYKLTLVGNHRRAVAQPCVNGDRLSKGRMAKFDPTQNRKVKLVTPKSLKPRISVSVQDRRMVIIDH